MCLLHRPKGKEKEKKKKKKIKRKIGKRKIKC